VIRTRVGYAGGTKKSPTYYSLGDHSETIDIEFDPDKISYKNLLNVFWEGHEPTEQPFSLQYASFVFYHSDEQRRLAQETKEQIESRKGQQVHTGIVAAGTFYPAEDYHQKYYLRRYEALVREVRSLTGQDDFTSSTVAARINGYLGGNGSLDHLKDQLKALGLSTEGIDRVVAVLRGATR